LRIPAGRTRGYGELARAVRRPKAARAIGSACGANPIPVLIPCHRVIGASGSLTGFSGGMHWKVKLLEIERVKLPLH
jgi:O-6-methylguanine DNA methyltransferase